MSARPVRPEKTPRTPTTPVKPSTAPTTASQDSTQDPQKPSPESELFHSIPKEILTTIHTWKVKSGVVLRSSQMQATSRMHRFKVIILKSSANLI